MKTVLLRSKLEPGRATFTFRSRVFGCTKAGSLPRRGKDVRLRRSESATKYDSKHASECCGTTGCGPSAVDISGVTLFIACRAAAIRALDGSAACVGVQLKKSAAQLFITVQAHCLGLAKIRLGFTCSIQHTIVMLTASSLARLSHLVAYLYQVMFTYVNLRRLRRAGHPLPTHPLLPIPPPLASKLQFPLLTAFILLLVCAVVVEAFNASTSQGLPDCSLPSEILRAALGLTWCVIQLFDRHSPVAMNVYYDYSLLGYALGLRPLQLAQLVIGATEFWSGLWKLDRPFVLHYSAELLSLHVPTVWSRLPHAHRQKVASLVGLLAGCAQLFVGIALLLPASPLRAPAALVCAAVHATIICAGIIPPFLYVWNLHVATCAGLVALYHAPGAWPIDASCLQHASALLSAASAGEALLLLLLGVVPLFSGTLVGYTRNMGYFVNGRPLRFVIWPTDASPGASWWVQKGYTVAACAPQLSPIVPRLGLAAASSRCVELRHISLLPAFNRMFTHGLLTDASDAEALAFVRGHAKLTDGVLVCVSCHSWWQRKRRVSVHDLSSGRLLVAPHRVPSALFGRHAFGFALTATHSSGDAALCASSWAKLPVMPRPGASADLDVMGSVDVEPAPPLGASSRQRRRSTSPPAQRRSARPLTRDAKGTTTQQHAEAWSGGAASPERMLADLEVGSPARFSWGVTMAFLDWLPTFVEETARERLSEAAATLTTEQLLWGTHARHSGPGPLGWCVAEHCRAEGCSFVQWCLRHGHTHDGAGRPFFARVTAFTSHAWGGLYAETVGALRLHAVEATAADSALAKTPSFFVDVFLNNPHVPPWREPNPLEPEEWLDRAIGAGGTLLLVLAPSDDPVALRRGWPLFEIWRCVRVGAQLDLRLPPAQLARLGVALREGRFDTRVWLRGLLIERAEVGASEDREKILARVDASCGRSTCNAAIAEALRPWLSPRGRLVASALQAL